MYVAYRLVGLCTCTVYVAVIYNVLASLLCSVGVWFSVDWVLSLIAACVSSAVSHTVGASLGLVGPLVAGVTGRQCAGWMHCLYCVGFIVSVNIAVEPISPAHHAYLLYCAYNIRI